MIVLTADEAAKVTGRSPKDESKVLAPVALKDGTFMLGEEVLDDPAHQDVAALLALLPRVPIDKLPVYGEGDKPPAVRETAELGERKPIDAAVIDAFRTTDR